MRRELIFLVLLGFASSLPLASDQNDSVSLIKESLQNAEVGSRIGLVESIVLALLEGLRNLMINGSENFPVLDPIFVENINLNESTLNMPNSHITIDDLTISDISTFEMEEIKFSMASLLLQRYKLDFNLVIPVVNVNTSSYDLSLRVFGGDVYGKGDMKLQIIKPRVHGYFVIGFRTSEGGIFIVLHECKIKIGLDSFEPVITGMFNNQASSDFVSAFLKNLVKEMLEFFEEEISYILSVVVLIVGNLVLYEFDLASLLPFI
nr:uncharacterized protein LOC113392441 [Vanessa tameamea]